MSPGSRDLLILLQEFTQNLWHYQKLPWKNSCTCAHIIGINIKHAPAWR